MRHIYKSKTTFALFILLTGCTLLPESTITKALDEYCKLSESERLAYRELINNSEHKITITCATK